MKRFNEGQVRDQVTLLPEGLEGWAAGVSSFGAVESLNTTSHLPMSTSDLAKRS